MLRPVDFIAQSTSEEHRLSRSRMRNSCGVSPRKRFTVAGAHHDRRLRVKNLREARHQSDTVSSTLERVVTFGINDRTEHREHCHHLKV